MAVAASCALPAPFRRDHVLFRSGALLDAPDMTAEHREKADAGVEPPASPSRDPASRRVNAEKAKAGVQPPDLPARERGPERRWREVARLATRQYGWVHRSQLRAVGVDHEAVRHAVRAGRLFPRRGELFLVGHEHIPPGTDEAAALLVAGPGAVLSHRSAAAAWGLLVWRGRVEVTTSAHRRSRRDVAIHQAPLDAKRDVTRRSGLPVTSLLRTIIDCAAVMTEEELAHLINEAAIKGWLHALNLAALLAMVRGRRGARQLRRVLEARDLSKGWTRSTLEAAFAKLVREADLPPYERGQLVDIGGGDLRECDALWRAARVMVELDFHETGRVPYRDRRRDRRLAAAGWTVIRLTGDDLTHHRDEVIADLRAALGGHA